MTDEAREPGWWGRVFGGGGAKLSVREQNEALQGELTRVSDELEACAAKVIDLETSAANARAAKAEFATTYDEQTQRLSHLESTLRDTTAAHSGLATQLKKEKKVAGDRKIRIEQQRVSVSNARSRVQVLEDTQTKDRAKLAVLTASVARTEELSRTAAHLHAELAKREQTVKARDSALVKTREALLRSESQIKAREAVLEKTTQTHRHKLDELMAKLKARDSSLAAAGEHGESLAAFAAEVLRLMGAVSTRWLGQATPLAIALVEHERGALDAKIVARVASELPLDIEVSLTSSGAIETHAGPKASPEVNEFLGCVLARVAGIDCRPLRKPAQRTYQSQRKDR